MRKAILMITLSASFFQFTSCEKETTTSLEIGAIEQKQDSIQGPYTMTSLDVDGIPKITDFLSSRAGKDIFKKEATTEKEDGVIIDEGVLMVNDTLGQANYSFRFTFPGDPENEFYNLVVGESIDGQPQEPQVFHYICDSEYYTEFEENGFDPIYFVGTVSIYPFDSIFKDGAFSKDTCAQHDQYGDPIPCVRTTMTNGASSGGQNSSAGGAPNNGGFASPTLSSYSLTATVYHVVPDGRTFVYGSGSKCQHPGECNIIFQRGSKKNQKTIDRGCSKCDGASGGVVANTGNRNKFKSTESFNLNEPAAYPFIHCSSFEYYKPPGALVTAAAVDGFQNNFWVLETRNGKEGYRKIYVRANRLYFTMPNWRPNGKAATLTAQAVNTATSVTQAWFVGNPRATKEALAARWQANIKTAMRGVGGNMSTVSPFPIKNASQFKTSIFTPGNCN